MERFVAPGTGEPLVVLRDPAPGEKRIEGADGRTFPDLAALREAEARDLGAPLCRIDPLLLRRLSDPGVRDAPVLGSSDLVNPVWVEAAPSRLPGLLLACPEVHQAVAVREYRGALSTSVPSTGASSFWSGGSTGSSASVAVLDSGMDDQHPGIKAALGAGKVLLAWASSLLGAASCWADDDTSTDDLHGHGTHCGGIVASRDTTYRGVARGAGLVNVKWMCRVYDSVTKQYSTTGLDADCFDGVAWARSRADVMNASFGGIVDESWSYAQDSLTLLFDAVVHDLDIDIAVAAGNRGSSSLAVGTPAVACNVITVGATWHNGTTATGDDTLATCSSRGPRRTAGASPT